MINQFDVYWVDLNPTIGAEMQKIRPCVVVSPDELNRYLNTVIIIPITSSIHGYPYRVRCTIKGRNGEIVTDQIRTVDRQRIKGKISSLTYEELTVLRNVLKQMFCD
jgi:mRNA interferase MazF